MLVLNTTSPPVTPSAPAARPRYQVPSSSARMASTMLLLVHLERGTDPCSLAFDDPYDCGPGAIAVELESNVVLSGLDLFQGKRRRADESAVHEYSRVRGSCFHLQLRRESAGSRGYGRSRRIGRGW